MPLLFSDSTGKARMDAKSLSWGQPEIPTHMDKQFPVRSAEQKILDTPAPASMNLSYNGLSPQPTLPAAAGRTISPRCMVRQPPCRDLSS